MPQTKAKRKPNKKLTVEIVTQMLTLATSGFGLVAALAWNSLVQDFVKNYVARWLPQNSGIISQLIYAVLVTILAVTVTVQLTKLKERLENK